MLLPWPVWFITLNKVNKELKLLSRKTKQDWYDIAYQGLIESGIEALSAEKLASKLGVSRGSFYHHFGSCEGFHKELLENWLQRNTLQIDQLNQGKSDSEKIQGLKEFAWALPHKIEVAIRSWALYDDLAKEYQIRVDKKRLDYITSLFEAKYERARAKKAAEVLFYAFVGIQNRQPMMTENQINSFSQLINEVIDGYLNN